MTDSQKPLLITILIVAACAIVYGQTIGFDFINIDDRPYVWENPAVQSGLNSRSIAWAFTSFYSSNWHPLTWLSHMLDAELYGPWAGGHHLTNAILHTINSLLVFVVLRGMTASDWKSGIVALLFAVHPAHVESVAWIAERKDVLSTMFWLLTMLAYSRYARSTTSDEEAPKRKRYVLMIPVVVLFILGLMSKPMLVTLPFVLLLCDYWPLRRLRTTADLRQLVIEKIPLLVLSIVSSVITVRAQSSGGAVASLGLVPLDTRLANAVVSFGRYIAKLFFPLELGIWYPLAVSINPIALVASALTLLTITFLVWRHRDGRAYLVMGWLWFVGTLVPVIGIVQVGLQSHADRYTYIPYLGLFILLVWHGEEVGRKRKLSWKLPAAAATVVILIMTALAYRQTSLWKNSETLYTHTLSFTENNHFLMSNLCLYYVAKADAATADRRCEELLGQMPPSVDSVQILGYLKVQTGKYDEAVRLFQDAERSNLQSGQTLLQLAQAEAFLGKPEDAERALQRAVLLKDAGANPEILARTYVVVADSLLKSGRKDKAIDLYQKALSLRPNMLEAKAGLEKLGIRQ
jgi:protein O-mannosyl-transferase